MTYFKLCFCLLDAYIYIGIGEDKSLICKLLLTLLLDVAINIETSKALMLENQKNNFEINLFWNYDLMKSFLGNH